MILEVSLAEETLKGICNILIRFIRRFFVASVLAGFLNGFRLWLNSLVESIQRYRLQCCDSPFYIVHTTFKSIHNFPAGGHDHTYCQGSFICCLCACPFSKESLQVLHDHDRDGFDVEEWRAWLLALSFVLNGVCVVAVVVVVVVAVTVAVITMLKRFMVLWFYCDLESLSLYSSRGRW